MVAIRCVCIALGCILLGVRAPLAFAADQRKLDARSEHGTEAFQVPEANLKIYETTPRPYHRKGENLVRATGKDCSACHQAKYYPGSDFFGWEWQKKWLVHWWLFSLSMVVMLPGFYAALLTWRRGQSPSLHHPVHWPSAVRAMVREVILGQRVRRQSGLRWAVFQLISMAFLALAVVFALIVVQRFLLPVFGFRAERAGLFLDFSADFLGGCILLGILLALYRRIAGRGRGHRSEAEDILVLVLLFGVVSTGFFLESCRLAAVEPRPVIWTSFLGAAGASVLKEWDLPWTSIRFYVWFVHAVLVFSLFAYIPFSKLFHLITSPVSIVATASEAHYKQRQ